MPNQTENHRWTQISTDESGFNAETQRFAEKRREEALSEEIWGRGGCGKESRQKDGGQKNWRFSSSFWVSSLFSVEWLLG